MRSIVEQTGRPLSMTVQQPEQVPDRWREMAAWVDAGVADGLPLRTQVAPRPIGVLQGLQASVNPIALCPSYREIADLALAARVAALRDPERRRRHHRRARRPRAPGSTGFVLTIFTGVRQAVPDGRSGRLRAARATASPPAPPRRGVDPVEEVLDLLVEDDGHQLLYMTLFNYAHGNLDDVREMLLSPNSVIGLSDAGAHCGAICDGSFPTTALALWSTRPRGRAAPRADGPPPDPAHGAAGRLARPWRARTRPPRRRQRHRPRRGSPPTRPHIVHDLPAGGRRLMQSASGYVRTIKRGVVTFADGEATGELPGQLVRGARAAPTGRRSAPPPTWPPPDRS